MPCASVLQRWFPMRLAAGTEQNLADQCTLVCGDVVQLFQQTFVSVAYGSPFGTGLAEKSGASAGRGRAWQPEMACLKVSNPSAIDSSLCWTCLPEASGLLARVKHLEDWTSAAITSCILVVICPAGCWPSILLFSFCQHEVLLSMHS